MVLVFHIITALGSLLAAGLAYANPSKFSIRMSYVFTAAMFASGTFLVISNTAHLLQACIMGLALLGSVAYLTTQAHRKLAARTTGSKEY